MIIDILAFTKHEYTQLYGYLYLGILTLIRVVTGVFNQNTFSKLYHNISFVQKTRKKGNKSHIIENLYLECYSYDLLLVYVVDRVKIYQVVHQTSRKRKF